MKEKLWTKKYLFSLLLVFGVNMGYALLNSVMAIYGIKLANSSVVGGYMITSFTLAALFIRLFIKKLNEKYSNKTLLVSGLSLTFIAAVGYCMSQNTFSFLIFRIVHGLGFGISLTCATAISNECVPLSRMSEGVGFTSSANTIANAVGPTIALSILGDKYDHFLSLFIILSMLSFLVFILSLFVKNSTKGIRTVGKKTSYQGIVIACIFFLATLSQSTVNNFLTSFSKQLHWGNIGPFFVISAVVTFVCRFFSKKMQDLFGLEKLSMILAVLLTGSLFCIPFVQNEIQLFIIAVPYGLATGLLFPIFNYRIIQTVDASQFSFATSIYYCGLDIGYGLGAVLWGFVIEFAGYQAIYFIACIILIVMMILDRISYRKMKI